MNSAKEIGLKRLGHWQNALRTELDAFCARASRHRRTVRDDDVVHAMVKPRLGDIHSVPVAFITQPHQQDLEANTDYGIAYESNRIIRRTKGSTYKQISYDQFFADLTVGSSASRAADLLEGITLYLRTQQFKTPSPIR